jgi:hypothetical protein
MFIKKKSNEKNKIKNNAQLILVVKNLLEMHVCWIAYAKMVTKETRAFLDV